MKFFYIPMTYEEADEEFGPSRNQRKIIERRDREEGLGGKPNPHAGTGSAHDRMGANSQERSVYSS